MDKREQLIKLTQKEISLSELSECLELNNHEILGYLRRLRQEGINIVNQTRDDDIYLFNQGEM